MLPLKPPKRLYSYNSHMEIETHDIGPSCVVEHIAEDKHGTRWRCQAYRGAEGIHDFYGYDKRSSAKSREIEETILLIAERHSWLKKLKGEEA